jgi:lysophospholipase L1-like esterase
MKLTHLLLVLLWSCTVLSSVPATEPVLVPTAFAAKARILFQGDSITDGSRGRNTDPNHILGHGYVFIIAAKIGADHPQLELDFVNRGVSGNTVLDLEKRWVKETLDLKPNLLSILVGVNDNRSIPFEKYEEVLNKLIKDAKAANPQVKLVLGEPFGLPVGRHVADWEKWNADLAKRRAIVVKLAKVHDAAVVRYQQAFDEASKRAPAEYWIWDGVHPTYRGHQIMADEWLKTVREHWPAK